MKLFSEEELAHFGVLGMKWGIRKDKGPKLSREAKNTNKLASKDAKRHAEAKMFYGKTAGTKRKLLKAELEKKKKLIPGYEDAFNKAFEEVDMAKAAKKAVRTRTRKDATYRTRVTTKQVLGVTGPLTVAAGTLLYNANRDAVNNFVARNASKAVSAIKNMKGGF